MKDKARALKQPRSGRMLDFGAYANQVVLAF